MLGFLICKILIRKNFFRVFLWTKILKELRLLSRTGDSDMVQEKKLTAQQGTLHYFKMQDIIHHKRLETRSAKTPLVITRF